MGFTPTQFEKLAINDLEYNKFVLDSNWNVAVRVSSVWGGWSVSLQNFVFVAKNGNDTTGLRNRIDKPFLTVEAAAAALQQKDTLWIMPGIYTPTTTVNITNCNIYLQDAIIDYGIANVWPVFNLSAVYSSGVPAHHVVYGSGAILWNPPSGAALIQTSSNSPQNASRYMFLKQVWSSELWLSGSAGCPMFKVTGRLSVVIYNKSLYNSYPATNWLFQFWNTSVDNVFLF